MYHRYTEKAYGNSGSSSQLLRITASKPSSASIPNMRARVQCAAASVLALSLHGFTSYVSWHWFLRVSSSPDESTFDSSDPSATAASTSPSATETGTFRLDAGRLRVHIDRQGRLEIETSLGTPVTESATSPYVRSDGRHHQLQLRASAASSGCDALGCFTAVSLEWRAAHMPNDSTALIMTDVRAYAGLDAVVFSQRFPGTLRRTAIGMPCGFIGGPAAGLYNDCGLVSATRLSLKGAYRNWMSWAGGGNSPEPIFGSFDGMVGQFCFLKEGGAHGGGAGGGGRVARGFLSLAYDGRAHATRSVQQALNAISLEPPWGQTATVSFSRAKAFCLAERRCRGFSWQAIASRAASLGIEPAPDEMIRVRWPVTNRPTFVTDSPADGRGSSL